MKKLLSKNKYGLSLIFVGIALLVIGQTIGLVTVNVQAIPSIPSDGATYTSLTLVEIVTPISMTADDGYVGLVSSVGYYQDGSFVAYMPEFSRTATDITWQLTITNPSTSAHTFEFNIRIWEEPIGYHYVRFGGSFTINPVPTVLTGDWYVGSTKILSPSQTVTAYTNSILFKFVKTSTVPDDTLVTATATWTGTASGSLSLTKKAGVSEWEGVQILANGSYNVVLRATDGTTVVQMNILMGIGQTYTITQEVSVWLLSKPLTWIGTIISIIGIALLVKQSRIIK